jgi:hypothetical protein
MSQMNEPQVSEEIAESDLDEDAEDVVEETDETSPAANEKDNELDSDNDLEEQELAEAVADDGELLIDLRFRMIQASLFLRRYRRRR